MGGEGKDRKRRINRLNRTCRIGRKRTKNGKELARCMDVKNVFYLLIRAFSIMYINAK